MQRWTAVVFVGLVALAITVVLVRTGGPSSVPLAPSRASSDGALAGGVPSSTASPDARALDAPDLDLGGSKVDRGGLALAPLEGLGPDRLPAAPGVGDPPGADAGGRTLPNGQPAPQLPANAPKSVTFGAVLVEYAGAEGAGPGARSKDDALTLAKKLAALAKTDFKAAVAQGDKGSGEDFGVMPRGILEAAPEFVLFSLKNGEVSEAVDSPRGFYVFKRND